MKTNAIIETATKNLEHSQSLIRRSGSHRWYGASIRLQGDTNVRPHDSSRSSSQQTTGLTAAVESHYVNSSTSMISFSEMKYEMRKGISVFLGAALMCFLCLGAMMAFGIDFDGYGPAQLYFPMVPKVSIVSFILGGPGSFAQDGSHDSMIEVRKARAAEFADAKWRFERDMVWSHDIPAAGAEQLSIKSEAQSMISPHRDDIQWKVGPSPEMIPNQGSYIEAAQSKCTKGDLDGVDLKHLLRYLSPKQRQDWLFRNLGRFKILQSDRISEAFPKRMAKFMQFDDDDSKENLSMNPPGSNTIVTMESEAVEADEVSRKLRGPSPRTRPRIDITKLQEKPSSRRKCELLVFMTWISPLSSFGSREQLSLESVFKTHPSACLVILSRSFDTEEGRAILHPFTKRGFKILPAAPNFPFLFKDTPALPWYRKLMQGKIDPGIISFSQNLSNLLRLAVLYKYGGLYIDTDVIVMKNLTSLGNAIGSQSVDENGNWTRVNNAVMLFTKRHPVMYEFIREFVRTFDGSIWGWNGPYLVSRVLNRNRKLPNPESNRKILAHLDAQRKLSNLKGDRKLFKPSSAERRVPARESSSLQATHSHSLDETCIVLPPLAFYPANWRDIREYLAAPKNSAERKRDAAELEKLEGESYTLHLWNKESRGFEVERGSILEKVFRRRCIFCEESVLEAALQPGRNRTQVMSDTSGQLIHRSIH